MKEFLEFIVAQLVDNTEAINVVVEETEKSTVLKLSVSQDEMGKIIGKEGKVAKAIRTVVKAASKNNGKPVYVEIV